MKTLYFWIVAPVLTLSICTGYAQESIPKYLQVARDIVQNVKPENNHYQSDKDRNIRFPGDLFTSELIVKTDCTGFVNVVLEKGNNIKPRFSTLEWPTYGYSLRDWVGGIERGEMFDKVALIQDLRPGDFLLWTYMYPQGTVALGAGHIIIVDAAPKRIDPQRSPVSPGLIQWEITALDESPGPNSPDDTRYVWKNPAAKTSDPNAYAPSKDDVELRGGAGRGRFYVYTDESGAIKAAAHAYRRDKIRVQDVDWHIIMARPRIKP